MGSKPDLVDRAALAERLGVNASTVARWHRRSILPEPDAVVADQELWVWKTVREWARHKSRFGKRPTSPVEAVDIVILADLTDRLGVAERTIAVWRANGHLPQPDYRWEATDAWLGATVDEWAHTTPSGRLSSMNGRPPVAGEERRPREPSGPRLHIPSTGLPEEVTSAAPDPDLPVAVAQPVPVAAVPVTPVREPSPDPVGDLEKIHRYFAAMAQTYQSTPSGA